MFFINFAGFFQVRLATDPDPTDEKRGVSGYTFALAGEQDLDRIIRLHDPVDLRAPAPPVGVWVTSVALGNEVLEDHPLVGAKFNLLGDPKFEMLNYILTMDAGTECIYPFIIEISSESSGIRIKRTDYLNPEDPTAGLYEASLAQMERRGGALGPLLDVGTMQEITQCSTPEEYRQKRLAFLQAEHASATDPVVKAGLETRIGQIQWPSADNIDWNDRRTMALRFVERRNFAMNGPAEIDPGGDALGVELDRSLDWPIQFWNGVWDCDLMVGYMRGTLQIPVVLGS